MKPEQSEKKILSGTAPNEDTTLDVKTQLILRGYKFLEEIGKDEGATGNTFLTSFQTDGFSRISALKLENYKPNPHSLTSLINFGKGDIYKNEIDFAKELSHPNIIEFISNFNINGTRVVETKYYPNAVSFQTLAKRGGMSDFKAFYELAKQTANAINYLNNEKEILHRDINPRNSIVSGNNVKVIDFQLAKKINDIEEEFLPTKGSGDYTHPKILNAIYNQEKSRSDKKTELYSTAKTLLFLRTGIDMMKYELKIDYESNHNINVMNANIPVSLYRNGQKVDTITNKMMKQDLKKWLKKIPRKERKDYKKSLSPETNKFQNILYKLANKMPESWRPNFEKEIKDFDTDYKNISEFETGLQKTYEKTLKGHKLWKTAALIGAGTLILGGLTINHLNSKNEELGEEMKKYRVSQSWNGYNPMIENNWFTARVSADISDEFSTKGVYQRYPEDRTLYIKPEGEIRGFVSAREIQGFKDISSPRLEGRVYLEGYNIADTISLYLNRSDQSIIDEGWYMGNYFYLKVPKELNNKVVNIITEIYSPIMPEPTEFNTSEIKTLEKFKFDKTEEILYQKRIPLVVGNPSDTIIIGSINVNHYENNVSFRHPEAESEYKDFRDVSTNVKYITSIPEIGYKDTLTSREGYSNVESFMNVFPYRDTTAGDRTFEVAIINKKNDIVGTYFIPYKIEERTFENGEKDHYSVARIPDKNYFHQIAKRREEIFKSHYQSR